MIQKYLNENILLIPSALYNKQDAYIFDWTIDKRFKVKGYGATYSFDKPGGHEIILKATDVLTGSYSIYKNIINVCNFSQDYSPAFIEQLKFGFGWGEFGWEDFGD
jgi:hypothetical protein